MVRVSSSDSSESSSISDDGIHTLKPLLDDCEIVEGADGSDAGLRLVDFRRGLASSSVGLVSSAGSSSVICREGRVELDDAGFRESLFALVRLRLEGDPVPVARTASSNVRGV